MSRRSRRVGPHGVQLSAAAALAEIRAGVLPAVPPGDRVAALDVLDMAGHRLARFGRYLGEADHGTVFWEASSTGPTTGIQTEDDRGDLWDGFGVPSGRTPISVLFHCKTCRDRGQEWHSFTSWSHVLSEVEALVANAGSRPVLGRVTAELWRHPGVK